jgi:hypothetical protein
MALVIEELITKWGFKVDPQGVERANAALQGLKGALQRLSLTALLSSGTLGAFFKKTFDYADAVDKNAKTLGLSTDSYQKLNYAAGLASISQDQFLMGMRTLSKVFAEAQRGSKQYTETLAALGISSEMLQDKNLKLDKVILTVADRFKSMPDGVQKTALATELFGRAGGRMINMLKDGSKGLRLMAQEAQDLGIILSEQEIKNTVELKDETSKLIITLKNLMYSVGARLSPVILEQVQYIKGWVLQNRNLIKTRVEKFILALTSLLKNAISIFKLFASAISLVTSMFGGFDATVKFLIKSFMILNALKLANNIGQLATSFVSLSSTIKSAASIFSLLTSKATLIGFAILSIGLIVEDLIAFFQGRDSVTALIVKGFAALYVKLKPYIDKLIELLIYLKDVALQVIDFLLVKISEFFNLIREWYYKLGIDKIVNFLGSVFSGAKKLLGLEQQKIETIRFIETSGIYAYPPTPETKNLNMSNNITAPITITVPPNTPPDQVGAHVRAGVSDALSEILKDTNLILTPATEY